MHGSILGAVVVLAAISNSCKAEERIEPIRRVEIGLNREFLVNGKPFLPIMSWAQNPKAFAMLSRLGFNTVRGNQQNVTAKMRCDAAQAAGGYAIHDFGEDGQGAIGRASLLAWNHGDEPDMPRRQNDAVQLSLAGKVLNGDGEPVAGTTVVLCDQETGQPLARGARQTIAAAIRAGKMQRGLARATTDHRGRFRFTGLPAGTYRLIAQSWGDAGKPDGDVPIKGVLEINGEILRLHGVAERVEVSADATPDVVIRPLGSGILRLDEDMPNDETLLLLSTAPAAADPVLGFVGWSGPMLRNLLGGNRMPRGKTTVYGLPAGQVHVVLFAADNSPGFGAGEAEILPGKVTDLYVPMVAGWSNGHHDPPKRLTPLFNEVTSLVTAGSFSVRRLLSDHGIDARNVGLMGSDTKLAQHLRTRLSLPSGRQATVGDLLAVQGYIDLQRRAAERGHRAQRSRQIARARSLLPEAERQGSYQESFLDLYAKLGTAYPCFELKGIDWAAVGRELLPRANSVTTDQQFGLLCMELVARLEDNHAAVLKGTLVPPRPDFPQWDPGFACLTDDRGKPVVYHVDKESPAEAAGVRIGMTVIALNGEPVEKCIERRMAELAKYIGWSSDRYLRYQTVRWFPRQMERGKRLVVTLQETDGKRHVLEMPATLGVRYLPRLPVPLAGVSDTADVSWTMLDDAIGYIYVRRIRGDLIEQLDRAVGQLKGARGLIVDVRGNSGGGFDSQRAFRNFALDDTAEPNRPRFSGPMALLIDARCISAGEGWTSWFIATRRATVFGETTAGASARKTMYRLKNGLFTVRFPVKAYRGSLSRPIERRGLEPDVALRQTAADLVARRDTVREAAREFLSARSYR